VRITTLSDNTTNRAGILAEHGLSLLVEVDGQRWLLDTGQTFTAVHNADVLGINLASISAVVLSHGHFDHTGGLRDLLRRVKDIRSSLTPISGQPSTWCAPKSAPATWGCPSPGRNWTAMARSFASLPSRLS